jgi:hypothetical protein
VPPTVQGSATYRNSGAGSATFAADSPAGIVAGEVLIVVFKFSSGAANAVWTDRGGFTELWDHASPSFGDAAVFGKVATSTDATNAGTASYYNFTLSVSAGLIQSSVFRVSDLALTQVDADFHQGGAQTTRTIPALTSPGADHLGIWVGTSNGAQTWTFDSGTEIVDSSGATASMAIAYAVVGTGDTPAVLTTASGSANLVSFGVLLAPAATGWSERTAPDAILGQHNLTGVVGNIDDDPDTPDGNWMVVG